MAQTDSWLNDSVPNGSHSYTFSVIFPAKFQQHVPLHNNMILAVLYSSTEDHIITKARVYAELFVLLMVEALVNFTRVLHFREYLWLVLKICASVT